MKVDWRIDGSDIVRLSDFITGHSGPHVALRIERNIAHKDLILDRDALINSLLFSFLLTGMSTGRYSSLSKDALEGLFTLRYEELTCVKDVRAYIHKLLKKYGIVVDINRIPEYFAINLGVMEAGGWRLLDLLERDLLKKGGKVAERRMADQIDSMFKGFGAVEARTFLQVLGLTKFEIPVDPVVSDWLNNFGFPVSLSATSLQDRNFYHFVSTGIQLLCEKANVYPCVLEAAIHSAPVERTVRA